MTALREDNQRLNVTVNELRGDRRSQERKLRDLQHQLDEARSKVVLATVELPPALPVEVAAPPASPVSPTAPRVVGITDDGEEIIYEGDAAAGKIATFDDEPPRAPPRNNPPPVSPPIAITPVGAAADRLEVTRRVAPVAARAPRAQLRDRERAPTERGGDAANAYRAAVDLVKAGDHERAVAALRAFIKDHARHDYADNAQYWLGEAFYAHKEYAQALIEFRNVVETYPRGNKVPDALLKVGYCYQSLGQTEKARAVLEQVVNLYPKTEPAALAAKRLESP
jgi:tol-pal system protein YbgF